MEHVRDLQLLTLALRDGLVDASRVVEAVAEWDRPTDHGLITFLIDRGVITEEIHQRLKQSSTPHPAASTPHDRSIDPDFDPTKTANASTADHTWENGAQSGFHPPDRYELIRLHRQGGLG